MAENVWFAADVGGLRTETQTFNDCILWSTREIPTLVWAIFLLVYYIILMSGARFTIITCDLDKCQSLAIED